MATNLPQPLPQPLPQRIFDVPNGGHVSYEVECGDCGRSPLWQKRDQSPDVDDWWCRDCHEWKDNDGGFKEPRSYYE